jgi:hypothetical protein
MGIVCEREHLNHGVQNYHNSEKRKCNLSPSPRNVKHHEPVILATQEAEIRRIDVQSQPGQRVGEDPVSENPSQKRAGGEAQGVGLDFKLYHRKKKKKKKVKKTFFDLCYNF